LDDPKPKVSDDVSAPPPPKGCGYTGESVTAPLMAGEAQIEIGSFTAVFKNSTVELSYKLTSQDCILVDSLHVNIVDEPLQSVHPSKFPCYSMGNQAMLQNFTCPLNVFDMKCCGTKTMYVEATALCAGELGTVYAGVPGCSGSDDWCNTMTIEPPCACGCDDNTDKCIDATFTCPECGGDVCDVSYFCPLIVETLQVRASGLSGLSLFGQLNNLNRQATPEKDQSTLKDTIRQVSSFNQCPSDCCPIGETVKMDLSYANLFEFSQFLFSSSSSSFDITKFSGCCPFCEALTDGTCSPVEEPCDACTIGGRKACKYAGEGFKWYVAHNLITV